MLSVLTPKKKNRNSKETKQLKKTFGSNRYFYYFGCGDSIAGACICPKLSNCIH